jgi:hypothetical protein
MRVAIILILSAIAAPSLAQQTNTQQSHTQSSSVAIASGGGQGSMEYKGEYGIRSAPAVTAPGLVTSFSDTCMGSTSIGVSGMGGALSAGSTWVDNDCVNRLNARQLQVMGQAMAAKEVMCQNPEVWLAYERIAVSTGNADLACLGPHPTEDNPAVKVRYRAPKRVPRPAIAQAPTTYPELDRLEQKLLADKQAQRR